MARRARVHAIEAADSDESRSPSRKCSLWPGDRRMLEEEQWRLEIDAEHVADTGDDADGEERMSAELEEVVVDANRFQIQHLGPDRRERRFGLSPGASDFVRKRRGHACVGRNAAASIGPVSITTAAT
jgi:hypothetical protein